MQDSTQQDWRGFFSSRPCYDLEEPRRADSESSFSSPPFLVACSIHENNGLNLSEISAHTSFQKQIFHSCDP